MTDHDDTPAPGPDDVSDTASSSTASSDEQSRRAIEHLLDEIFGTEQPGRLVNEFPSGLLDRDGSVLTPGTSVTVVDGPHRNERGVIHGWAGERSVTLVVEGAGTGRPPTPPTSSDRWATPPDVADVAPLPGPSPAAQADAPGDTAPTPDESGDDGTISTAGLDGVQLPAVVEVDHLVCNPDPGAGQRIGLEVIAPGDTPTVLIVPVGGRDIQARPGDPGPFPDPADHSSGRAGQQRKVDARAWGQACLRAISDQPEAEQARLVARHLDAPMLRRVLTEAVLPAELRRLTLVVTDQATVERPDGHVDDSLYFGRLLELWVQGTQQQRTRQIRELGDPIVLSSRPNVTHAVLATIRRSIDTVVDGCDEVVIVQAGGTPAMFTGLETAVASRPNLRVRITQPVEDGPLYDVAVN